MRTVIGYSNINYGNFTEGFNLWITCGTCFTMMGNLSIHYWNAKYWHVKSKDPFGEGRWNKHKKQSAHLKMCQLRVGDQIATNHTMNIPFFITHPKKRSAQQYLLELPTCLWNSIGWNDV